jgi:3-hydroxyisobutyrate dehydrogenase-like beta-hydroxyacid dehydrogenase
VFEMSEAIGFIGLGALGLPIATNLADAGHTLRLYNRTASKAQPLVDRGLPLATRPADAVTAGGIVVSVLWDDAALESVVTSDGFLERLGQGGVHVSMSTVTPETGRRMAALHADAGSDYVEATVFGRPEAAAARKLWIATAGAQAAKDRVRPLLDAMGAQGVFDFGEAVGAATVVKLAGNFLMISAARSLGEALSMADKQGVDMKAVVDMLTTTLFPAPIYQNYGKMLAERTAPLSQSDIPLKDVGLFRRTAEQVQSPTPVSSALYDLLGADRRG